MFDQIIKKPVVTEKSTLQQKNGQYTFIVNNRATKVGIKSVIQRLYGVKVKNVNIIKVNSKTRIAGRGKTIKKRDAQKKAIVTIEKNKTIDIHKLSSTKK